MFGSPLGQVSLQIVLATICLGGENPADDRLSGDDMSRDKQSGSQKNEVRSFLKRLDPSKNGTVRSGLGP